MKDGEFDPHAAALHMESIQSPKLNSILKSDLREMCQLYIDNKYGDCLKNCNLTIDYVWEKLNTGHWSEIDDMWRHIYYVASVYKALCQKNLGAAQKECARTCDMGLLMGLKPLGWAYELTALVIYIYRPSESKVNKNKSPTKKRNSSKQCECGL